MYILRCAFSPFVIHLNHLVIHTIRNYFHSLLLDHAQSLPTLEDEFSFDIMEVDRFLDCSANRPPYRGHLQYPILCPGIRVPPRYTWRSGSLPDTA